MATTLSHMSVLGRHFPHTTTQHSSILFSQSTGILLSRRLKLQKRRLIEYSDNLKIPSPPNFPGLGVERTLIYPKRTLAGKVLK